MELLRKQHSDLEIDFKEVQSKFQQATDDMTNLQKKVSYCSDVYQLDYIDIISHRVMN